MKKIFILILLFFISTFIFAEQIDTYLVNIKLNRDSSLDVIENIYYNFGNEYKHGIYRYIPINFEVIGQKNDEGVSKRVIKINNIEVYRNGEKENIASRSYVNDNFVLKIGEKNKTVTGLHNYIIKYKVRGAIRYFKDYDELYWNAIGNGWKVPIKTAKIILSSEDIPFLNKKCYQGSVNSTEPCLIKNNIFSINRILQQGEGVTIATSFKKGLVKKEIFWGINWKKWLYIIGGFFVFLISIFSFLIYKFKNKFKPDSPIIPIYKPYKNYHPTLTGFLIDQRLDPRDITAGIISLAQKGYIKIKRTENRKVFFKTIDYEFIFLGDVSDITDELDKLIFNFLFSELDTNNLQDQKSIRLSDLSLLDSKRRLSWQNRKIKKFLKKYAENNHFIEKNKYGGRIMFFLYSIFIIIGLFSFMYISWSLIYFYAILIINLLSFIYISFRNRKTRIGWDAENNLKGFQMYLSYTGKERMEMLNSPKLNPQKFLEYLPYAIAFGVEKKWQKQFKSITIPKPDWYVSDGPFIYNSFISDISNLSSNISNAMSVSGSGTSGGFSGGGAGGGGGGSW